MDMSKSYISAAQEFLPDIDIVFDRFHIMQMMNKALDTIRKQECSLLNKEDKKVLKGQRFLLLKNYSDLSEDDNISLNALFSVNIRLFQAHAIKEQLRLFWTKPKANGAAKFLFKWIDSAKRLKIEPLVKVANCLENNFYHIISYFRHKITNGKAEGLNNKIKTLKRQAYGFRDMEYFKLRLYHLHMQKSRLCG